MNKTEREFEQTIRRKVYADDLDVCNIEDAAESVYQLHRKEAISFAEWVENRYASIYSKELDKSMYVDCIENDVLIHGSDYHFTQLITDHGKTIDQLFDLFTTSNEGNNEKE